MPDHQNHPFYKVDAGAPHMDEENYRQMGLPEPGREAEAEPANPELDSRVQAEIEQKFAQHQLVDECRTEIRVLGGRVTLDGTATTRFARSRAEDLALEVEGVTGVDNHIHIQAESEAGGPILTVRDPEAESEPSTQRS